MAPFITGDRSCFAPTRRSRGGGGRVEFPPAPSGHGLGRTAPSSPVNIDRIHSFGYTRSLLLTRRLSLLFLVFAALFLGVSAGPDTAGRRRSAAPDLPPAVVPVAQRLGRRAADATNSTGDYVVPTAFDNLALSVNLTSSCSTFLRSVVSNSTFNDCVPLSGLIRDSVRFFDILGKGAYAITKVLDASCSVDVNKCSALMDSFSAQINTDENCGTDYSTGNPVVSDVFVAFVAYKPLFAAGCMKSLKGDYCYVDAATNTTSPADAYIYSIPLGMNLPGGSRPTCNDCLSKTMAIFDIDAGNHTQPLFNTYVPAAEQLNMGCGPGFVNTTVVQISSASSRSVGIPFSAAAAVLAGVLLQQYL